MQPDPRSPTPWESLRPWPAWRGLEDSLLELAGLLRRIDAASGTGSGALEIAEEITAVLLDPESQLPSADWYRRFTPSPAAKAEEQPDVDEIPQLLRELACWVADAPVLLDSPDASRHLSQTLIQELPRWWQGRFSPLLFGLRQMLQGAARKLGAAAAGETRRAAPVGIGTEQPDPFPPRLLLSRGSDYYLVLPEDASPALVAAAQCELLYGVLRDCGPAAARLHLLLLAQVGGESTGYLEMHRALGLQRSRSLTRREKDEHCHALLKALSGLRVIILRHHLEGTALTCSRTSRPLWELKLHHFGQAQLEERRGGVVARGQDWSVQVLDSALPGSGTVLLADEGLTGARQALSLALTIVLAHAGAGGKAVPITNRTVLSLAALPLWPENRREMAVLWQGLRQAARAQGAHGWQPDLTGWPAEVGRRLTRPTPTGPDGEAPEEPPALEAPEWERFLEASTTFVQQAEPDQ